MKFVYKRRFDEEAHRRNASVPPDALTILLSNDEQFDRAQAVNGNTQLYKQAGNAVTVNVTYEIGKHFMAIFEGELN